MVVPASGPSCLWPRFLIHLLHAVSHCRIPSEGKERSLRLLLALRNMKRPMQRAGLAANEQTVGGWLLPHTSAADGPLGERDTGRPGPMNRNGDFSFFLHYLKIWTCNLEATESQGKQEMERKVERRRTAGSRSFSVCAIKKQNKFWFWFWSVLRPAQALLFVLISAQSIDYLSRV